MATETFPSLVYPIEMKPENFYPEAMCFTVKKRIGISIDDVAGAVGGAVDSITGKFAAANAKRDVYEEAVANAKDDRAMGLIADQTELETILAKLKTNYEAKKNKTSLAKEALTDAYGVVKTIGGKYQAQKEIQRKNTTANNIGHIYLNMPQAISYTDSISWDAKPLGAIGSIMDGGVGTAAAGGTLGAAGNIAGAGIGGMMMKLASKLKIPGGVGLGVFAGAMAGGQAQDALSATLGMTSNPFEEMMFSGITFRSFSFEFIFRPENDKEIIVVDKIIKTFRQYSRPSFQGGALGKTIMNYPMEYGIEFLTADAGDTKFEGEDATKKAEGDVYKTNQHLPFIKTCVCESVATNYTPQSVWAAYNSGAPVAISLSLGFKEKELVMDKDVEGGY
jgi:hypothetical protein